MKETLQKEKANMIMFGLFPSVEGGFVRGYYKNSTSKHLGIDIAPNDKAYKGCDNLAWNDGEVVAVYTLENGEDWGRAVVIEHKFNDKKVWSGYFHNEKTYVKKGQKVYLGEPIGKRGNTGKSSGEHIHFQLAIVDSSLKYTYSNFDKYAIDPLPYMFRDDRFTKSLSPYFKELPIKYLPIFPAPVERDKSKRQVEVLIDYLYVRNKPSGESYAWFAKEGIYDVLAESESGNYVWYKIGESNGCEFWIASGGKRTNDLPVEDEIEALREELREQHRIILQLEESLAEATEASDTKQKKLDEIKTIIEE